MVDKKEREQIYILGLRTIRDVTQALNYIHTYDDYDAAENLSQAVDNLNECIAEFNKHKKEY